VDSATGKGGLGPMGVSSGLVFGRRGGECEGPPAQIAGKRGFGSSWKGVLGGVWA
jgi:hypothetical protein